MGTRRVADLGNSRLKWGRIGPDGRIAESVALPIGDPAAWSRQLDSWEAVDGPADWAIASVNPSVADRLGRLLADRARSIRWYRSAADVPIRHALNHADRAGADRALAVARAIDLAPSNQPGRVISCGTAITVERIDAEGVWQGGAITAGMGLLSRALNSGTAQLPGIDAAFIDGEPPPAWGNSTIPAIRAGVFWGVVGAVRELLGPRTADGWRIWTGGNAPILAPQVDGPDAWIVPDLVLQGLAGAAFGRVEKTP